MFASSVFSVVVSRRALVAFLEGLVGWIIVALLRAVLTLSSTALAVLLGPLGPPWGSLVFQLALGSSWLPRLDSDFGSVGRGERGE